MSSLANSSRVCVITRLNAPGALGLGLLYDRSGLPRGRTLCIQYIYIYTVIDDWFDFMSQRIRRHVQVHLHTVISSGTSTKIANTASAPSTARSSRYRPAPAQARRPKSQVRAPPSPSGYMQASPWAQSSAAVRAIARWCSVATALPATATTSAWSSRRRRHTKSTANMHVLTPSPAHRLPSGGQYHSAASITCCKCNAEE